MSLRHKIFSLISVLLLLLGMVLAYQPTATTQVNASAGTYKGLEQQDSSLATGNANVFLGYNAGVPFAPVYNLQTTIRGYLNTPKCDEGPVSSWTTSVSTICDVAIGPGSEIAGQYNLLVGTQGTGGIVNGSHNVLIGSSQ